MRGKEASKMAVNGVWGGVRKRIRKAVKVFNYKVVPGGRPFRICFEVWRSEAPTIRLKQG